MRVVVALLVCISAVAAFTPGFNVFGRGTTGSVNGGGTCAACTVVTGIVDQLAEIHNKTVAEVLSDVCTWLPKEMQEPCESLVAQYGPYIIDYLAEHLSPDEVCLKMTLCKSPTCRLFPATTEEGARRAFESSKPIAGGAFGITPWDWIKKEIIRVFDTHEPLVDLDNDLFSTYPTLRGASWRGKDCHDFEKDAYPGRKDDGSGDIDGNCNGIVGRDEHGTPYEELWCSNTTTYGTVILGDSAAAHFHIPPEYLNPRDMNQSTYEQLLFALENEFDWPQQSSTTGYVEVANRWDQGPVMSLYMKMREHNRCNHRDFQNIAVNGGRSSSMNHTIIRSLARNPEKDKPLLAFYALIGNDVCDGHPDYWKHMTTPEEFKANVMDALLYFDEVAPPGSHVVFTGLADGRVLYDNMHNLSHPVGGGVTYVDLYNYLNCLELSPCLVWMNDNATIRDAGSARAAELNQQYAAIIKEHTFKNFDMQYYDFPFAEISKIWTDKGGKVSDLIEPVDGFHPNQNAMALTAQVFWDKLNKDHPDWLGPPNPHNADIAAKFGDQGGY